MATEVRNNSFSFGWQGLTTVDDTHISAIEIALEGGNRYWVDLDEGVTTPSPKGEGF